MRNRGPTSVTTKWATVVAAAAFIGGYFAMMPRVGSHPPSKASMTRMELATIANAIKAFQEDKGALPQTVAELQVGGTMCYLVPDKPLRDSWGREFVYSPVPADGHPYQLLSKGPDGRFPSADDIDPWHHETKQ